MKFDKILVSEKSFNSQEPYDLVYSNITVINLLKEEGVKEEDIHEDALASYWLDYYLAQYNNGNFPQYVWNSKWSKRINDYVEAGLTKSGAVKHLELFKSLSERVESLSKEVLDEFFESEYFGENETRDSLKDYSFYDIDEDLIQLNSNFLRNHPHLVVRSIDDMFVELEEFLGRKIER